MRDRVRRRRVDVTAAQMEAGTYSEVSGHLLTLCDSLGAVASALNEDGTNHEETLRDWYATFMDGIMSYSEGTIRPVSRGRARYAELFDAYSRILKQAFVASDVSAEVNYEALEFLGDGQWKAALVAYFMRERRISNESILTVLKHTHENTKALSDLARMFHMDKLAQHGGTKQIDAVCEDVFEAVMGALQYVQWELQRALTKPHGAEAQGAPRTRAAGVARGAGAGDKDFVDGPEASAEALQFCADNGFSNRLVRMIFACSDAAYTHRIAPKTFITSLNRTFGGDKEAIYAKQETTATSIQISFHTREDVVARIAQVFTCSSVALGEVLNAFYETRSASVNSKHFSSLVYEDLVKRLSRLGIDQGTLQTKKNLALVPPPFHARLNALAARAAEKGYWLAINAPKAKGDTRTLKLQASLYHDDPGGRVQKATEPIAGESAQERERAFRALFNRTQDLIEAVAPAGPPDHGVEDSKGKTRFSVRIGERRYASADEVRAPERPALNWAYRASMTSVGHSAILQGAVASANQQPERRNRTLGELYLELAERSQEASGITAETLRHMLSDRKLRQDFLEEMASEKRPAVAVLTDKTPEGSTTYSVLEFVPVEKGKPAIAVRGTPAKEYLALLGSIAGSLEYLEPSTISHNELLAKLRQWAGKFPNNEGDYPELA